MNNAPSQIIVAKNCGSKMFSGETCSIADRKEGGRFNYGIGTSNRCVYKTSAVCLWIPCLHPNGLCTVAHKCLSHCVSVCAQAVRGACDGTFSLGLICLCFIHWQMQLKHSLTRSCLSCDDRDFLDLWAL